MTQIDIEKIILENGFKLEDKQGHITYEFGTGDIYRISQLLFKKMNYIPCSTQLKDKVKFNFENWLFSNGIRYVSDHTYKNAKGTLYTQQDLQIMYKKYLHL